MNKLFLVLSIILVLIIIFVGGYFGAEYYFKTNFTSDYFFAHPTLARIFNITPSCLADGMQVCGTNGKNYPNKCLALQSKAGYAYDGPCLAGYENKTYGFSMKFPNSWKGFYVEKSTWQGQKIDGEKVGDYKGVELIFKNPQTTEKQQYQDIPIMVFIPDVWQLVSGSNPTITISATPIGPEKIGENEKYIFATPPRWYGFTDAVGYKEALEILKTFKAF